MVREGRRTGTLQARLVTSRGELPHDELAAALPADSVLWTQIEGVAETTRGGKTKKLKGPAGDRGGRSRSRAPRCASAISPDAFFQTNTEMAERLYATAAELAGLSGSERVFDLFCGIGTISLALALEAREVVGVELVERAVADAIENAKLNGMDNARFYAGDIRTAMRPLLEEEGKADVVVIDPPRAGLSQKVVRRVLEVGGGEDRLRVLQPHDAGAQRAPDGGRGLRAEGGAPGGHVPPDAAHRERGAAGAAALSRTFASTC